MFCKMEDLCSRVSVRMIVGAVGNRGPSAIRHGRSLWRRKVLTTSQNEALQVFERKVIEPEKLEMSKRNNQDSRNELRWLSVWWVLNEDETPRAGKTQHSRVQIGLEVLRIFQLFLGQFRLLVCLLELISSHGWPRFHWF